MGLLTCYVSTSATRIIEISLSLFSAEAFALYFPLLSTTTQCYQTFRFFLLDGLWLVLSPSPCLEFLSELKLSSLNKESTSDDSFSDKELKKNDKTKKRLEEEHFRSRLVAKRQRHTKYCTHKVFA